MKRHLRVSHNELDTEILSTFAAAREWIERAYDRTFRTTVARRIERGEWPADRLYLGYPPLVSVDSVKYYDTDNTQQTVSSSNYYVVTSTFSTSFVEWATTYTLPDLYDRPDAVQVNYSTGYASRDVIPNVPKQAIKLLAAAWYHEDDQAKWQQAQRAAQNLMSTWDWGAYA